MGSRKIPEPRMMVFWTSFVLVNLYYYSYVRQVDNLPRFKWSRQLPTDYIDDRSCSQLSYIWNFGAPRGCEVTEESRRSSSWEHRRVPANHSEAPTSILLHDVHTTGGHFSQAKLLYFGFLCLSGFFVVYKYVYPLFGIRWT